MYQKPSWSRQGRDWPHRGTSRFVSAGGISWHVQIVGEGPVLLLLHGTGAATHSWANIIPLLARNYTLVVPDLPGHGFTETPDNKGLSLPGMSKLIVALLKELNLFPATIIGHSAGAAIGAELLLTGGVDAADLIAINGAFKPFDGLASHLFPAVAKLVVLNPITIYALASRGGDRARVKRLMAATGSTIDERSIDLYARLFGTTGHVNGVLGMMSRWDLAKLVPRLPALSAHLTLIVGTKDLTISPSVSSDVRKLVPDGELIELPGLGHLAHEEAPQIVADAIEAALNQSKLA